jgi:hypothetical protein
MAEEYYHFESEERTEMACLTRYPSPRAGTQGTGRHKELFDYDQLRY